MVWSAHSHIGRCSCGDSSFIVWSALSFSWLSGCSAASHRVGRLDGWPTAGDIDASIGQSRRRLEVLSSSFGHGPELGSGASYIVFSLELLPVPLVGASFLLGNVVNRA